MKKYLPKIITSVLVVTLVFWTFSPKDTFATVLATDNFNRANSTGLGANWTKPTAATNQFNVSSNTAVPASFSSGDSFDAYSGAGLFPNDQYSKVKVTVTGTAGGGSGMGPMIRMDLAQKTGYTLVVDHAASNNVELAKLVNNVYTVLGNATQAFTDGDYFEVRAQGTAISVIYNGNVIISVTDSVGTITSGYPGIRFSTSETSASGDDWEGGSLSNAVPPKLSVNGALTVSPGLRVQ